jgi:hypothetical protein
MAFTDMVANDVLRGALNHPRDYCILPQIANARLILWFVGHKTSWKITSTLEVHNRKLESRHVGPDQVYPPYTHSEPADWQATCLVLTIWLLLEGMHGDNGSIGDKKNCC